MKYRTFGSSGLRVCELILGSMTFGEQGGVGAPIEECRRILDAYAEAGGNAVDTAINYRGGLSEEFVGELLDGRREDFVLSTKYSVSRNPDDPNAAGNARKNLRASLEVSLRRLRTDYLDVYWVHMWDRGTPIEETMRALDDAVAAGKVLYVGISDAPAWVVARGNTLAQWHGWSPFIGVQVPYSLLQRDIERELLPLAESLDLGVAAWSPLAGGLLSGKYAPGAEAATRRLGDHEVSEEEARVIAAVTAVADEIGVAPAQVALRWVMAQSPRIHPLLGARTVDQLRTNLAVLDTELDDEALARLTEATTFDVGFPSSFIADQQEWVFGAAQVD